MSKTKTIALVQLIGLVLFGGMAISSASSKDTASSIDWRGAAVGAAVGYDGYIIIGTASSEAAAIKLAESKGYDYYIWDSVNGKVYAK